MLLRKLRLTYKTLTILTLGVYKPRYTSIKIVIFEKILKKLEKINNSSTKNIQPLRLLVYKVHGISNNMPRQLSDNYYL